jgi:hypothetical protein
MIVFSPIDADAPLRGLESQMVVGMVGRRLHWDEMTWEKGGRIL